MHENRFTRKDASHLNLQSSKANAIFLDRDGTLNYDSGYTYLTEDLVILDQVIPALQLFYSLGFLLIIITNQSGIARGYFTVEDMDIFNNLLTKKLADHGIVIDAIYYCPYHPTEGVGEWLLDSPLRKPNPGMLLQAASERNIDLTRSFMIGNSYEDMEAGVNAGCCSILVESDSAKQAKIFTRLQENHKSHVNIEVVSNLLEAAYIVQSKIK